MNKNLFFLILSLLIFFNCATRNRDLLDCNIEKYGKSNEKLFLAVKRDDINSVKKYLESDAKTDVSDYLEQSALMWAAWYGYEDMVKILLNHKKNYFEKLKLPYSKSIKPNASKENIFKYNALMCAINSNNENIVKILLNENIDFNKKDDYKESPLYKAVKNNNFDITKILLSSKNIDIDSKDSFGNTVLHRSVINNNEDILDLLLKNNADINAKNDNGETPLMLAFNNSKGNFILFLKLLEKIKKDDLYIINSEGKDINAIITDKLNNKLGSTKIEKDNSNMERVEKYRKCVKNKKEGKPLFDEDLKNIFTKFISLIRENKIEKIKYMLSKDDWLVSYKDEKSNKSALFIAIEENNLEIFKTLLTYYKDKNNANLNSIENDIFFESVKHKNKDMINYLIDNRNIFNLNFSNKDSEGNTPFFYFIKEDNLTQNENLVTFFLGENKSNLNIKNLKGETLLQLIIQYKREYLLKEILKLDINNNLTTKIDETPITIYALRNNFITGLKLLVSDRTDLKQKDENDKILMDYLKERKNEDAIKEIIEIIENIEKNNKK